MCVNKQDVGVATHLRIGFLRLSSHLPYACRCSFLKTVTLKIVPLLLPENSNSKNRNSVQQRPAQTQAPNIDQLQQTLR
jgi:hypothetical protein